MDFQWEGPLTMNLQIHVIMGINEESLRLAKYLQQQKEMVYICDSAANGMSKRDDYIFVGKDFVDAIDYSLFKVYTYEHPYKTRQHLRVLYAPVSGDKSDDQDDEKYRGKE